MHDVRFAWRMLRTRRTLTFVAVLTIALGIGAATAIFSVVDGVLLRPLPYREPSQLVSLWRTFPDWRKDPAVARSWDQISFTLPEYLDLRTTMRALSELGVWRTSSSVRADGSAPEEVIVTHASASLLPLLGVQPVLGRRFLPGEDGPGAPRITILSYEYWQRSYGGSPSVTGTLVRLDSTTYQIVGVLPKGFRLASERIREPAAYWVPAGIEPFELADNNRMFDAIGRVAPGATIDQVRVEAAHLFEAHLKRAMPTDARVAVTQTDVTAPVRGPLMLVLAASGLLLLITCGNVATLLLGDAARREQEMATRISLGASRFRVARQLLTEHLILAVAGSLLGILVAWGATHLLLSLAPRSIPRLNEVGMSARTLAFACASAVATAALFGLAPMLSLVGTKPSMLIRSPGSRATARRATLERAGLALQIALSVVLLVGASLLGRTLQRLGTVDLGFHPDNLLFVKPNVPAIRYSDAASRVAFVRRFAANVRAIPGVRAVSIGYGVPFGDGRSGTSIEAERVGGERFASDAQYRLYDPGMTEMLGISLLDGRTFGREDGANAPRVMVVNETMARRFWPNQRALGQRALIDKEWRTVVGVTRDVKHQRPDEDVLPTFYLPVDQSVRAWSLSLAVQAEHEPSALVAPVRAALKALDPGVALSSVEPVTAIVYRSIAEYRFRATVVAFFALVAGVLSAAGVYGVTAGAVNRRVREMGIRMALGATPSSVVVLVVRGILVLAAVGAAAGGIATMLTSRALTPFLYGVTPNDIPTYAGVMLCLAVAVLVSSALPAFRAGRVQPASALRE